MLSKILALCLLSLLWQQGKDDIWKLNPSGDLKAPSKVYVPKDLEDAFAELEKMLRPELVARMKEGPLEAMIDYHHGLGTWLRNNWGLWRGSRLATYFRSIGVYHPDDMSSVILDSFWKRLHGQPLELQKQARKYRTYWAAMAPASMSCPWDRSEVEVRGSLPGTLRDGVPARVYVGRCSLKGHLWAGQYERNVFRPVGPMLTQVQTMERESKKPWR